MKRTLIVILVTATVLLTTGCGPSAKKYTLTERRQLIDNMANQNLERLYIERPETRQQIAEAAGYGVFSNANVYVIFASAGGGYGVVLDKETGRKTYMKVSSGGVGIGVGAKDYREIVIFKTRQALLNFIGSGWGFGVQAEAAAKSGETGGRMGGDGAISKDVTVYTLTETGLALQATIGGARYWVDDELNQPSF